MSADPPGRLVPEAVTRHGEESALRQSGSGQLGVSVEALGRVEHVMHSADCCRRKPHRHRQPQAGAGHAAEVGFWERFRRAGRRRAAGQRGRLRGPGRRGVSRWVRWHRRRRSAGRLPSGVRRAERSAGHRPARWRVRRSAEKPLGPCLFLGERHVQSEIVEFQPNCLNRLGAVNQPIGHGSGLSLGERLR